MPSRPSSAASGTSSSQHEEEDSRSGTEDESSGSGTDAAADDDQEKQSESTDHSSDEKSDNDGDAEVEGTSVTDDDDSAEAENDSEQDPGGSEHDSAKTSISDREDNRSASGVDDGSNTSGQEDSRGQSDDDSSSEDERESASGGGDELLLDSRRSDRSEEPSPRISDRSHLSNKGSDESVEGNESGREDSGHERGEVPTDDGSAADSSSEEERSDHEASGNESNDQVEGGNNDVPATDQYDESAQKQATALSSDTPLSSRRQSEVTNDEDDQRDSSSTRTSSRGGKDGTGINEQDTRQEHEAATRIQKVARGRWSRRSRNNRTTPSAKSQLPSSSGSGDDEGGGDDEEHGETARRIQEPAQRNLKRKQLITEPGDDQNVAARCIQKHVRRRLHGKYAQDENPSVMAVPGRVRRGKMSTEQQKKGKTTTNEDAAARRIQRGARRRFLSKNRTISAEGSNKLDEDRDNDTRSQDCDSYRHADNAANNQHPPHPHKPQCPKSVTPTHHRHRHQHRSSPCSSPLHPQVPHTHRSQSRSPAPVGWTSPGKAAAKAAAAAAAAAATAASASVRAAEAAADAADAAEMAADAEDQSFLCDGDICCGESHNEAALDPIGLSPRHMDDSHQRGQEEALPSCHGSPVKRKMPSVLPSRISHQEDRSSDSESSVVGVDSMYRSPPRRRPLRSLHSEEEGRRHHHQQREHRHEQHKHATGTRVDNTPGGHDLMSTAGAGDVARSPKRSTRAVDHGDWTEGSEADSDGSAAARGVMKYGGPGDRHREGVRQVEDRNRDAEEEKLRKARQQARKHARDRRARALAKEEESRRELQTVQNDLMKAEEMRAKQELLEKAALEAKRARVVEDMRRRQQRILRLQQEEGRLVTRSRSPRKDGDTAANLHVDEGGGQSTHGSSPRVAPAGGESSSGVPVSLPRLDGGGEPRARQRQPRHVSAFRARILQERRDRKEIGTLKRKEMEEKLGRQAQYAARVRAQAKRALAAEQRRAQEEAARVSRLALRGPGSRVDRIPVPITKPNKEKGEWGVFSYAPDPSPSITTQHAAAANDRDATALDSGGHRNLSHNNQAGLASRSAARRDSGRGNGDTISRKRRASTPELLERMRQERAKATEFSRARAAAAATAAGATHGSHVPQGHHVEATAHRPAPPHDRGSGRTAASSGRPAGVTIGGGGRNSSGWRGNATSETKVGGEALTAKSPRYKEHSDGNRPQRAGDGGQSIATGDSVYDMYEARLASLERRIAGGFAGEKHQRNHARPTPVDRLCNSSSGKNEIPGAVNLEQGSVGRGSSFNVDLHEESPNWGPSNNPFGYRDASSDGRVGLDGGRGEGPVDRGRPGRVGRGHSRGSGSGSGSGSGVHRRGSASSGDVEVEGLSSLYMGPIQQKMAELRAAKV